MEDQNDPEHGQVPRRVWLRAYLIQLDHCFNWSYVQLCVLVRSWARMDFDHIESCPILQHADSF